MTPGRLLADNRNERALATRLRRKRFGILRTLVACTPPPVTILDVGGTAAYWRMMGFRDTEDVRVVLLNLGHDDPPSPPYSFFQGDARDLGQFRDGEFEIVFSNSVIEHVGGIEDQRRMAHEVRRVGRKYCVQTPNRSFPIEPHFLFPFFQRLPLGARIWLVRHFSLGWFKRATDDAAAREVVTGIRLLSRQEMRDLFPDGDLYEERFLGLVKSFVAHTPVCKGSMAGSSSDGSGQQR
jgi:hypothetical protein